MSCKDFVERTVLSLDEKLFCELKRCLVGTYIKFEFIDAGDISPKILAEKICDSFDKIESGSYKSFEKIVEKYISDLDSVVGFRIAQVSKQKKNEPAPETPRARKYYDKACQIRKENKQTKRGLIDYSRIMLCLYMSIIYNDFKVIDDFDYAISCLNIDKIIWTVQNGDKKSRFDQGTIVLLIIMFYYIKSKETIEEY